VNHKIDNHLENIEFSHLPLLSKVAVLSGECTLTMKVCLNFCNYSAIVMLSTLVTILTLLN